MSANFTLDLKLKDGKLPISHKAKAFNDK